MPTTTDSPALVQRWRRASLDSVWLRPGDWHTPAADALAEALVARTDVAAPAFRLGKARSEAGVGVTETIDDVAVLFSAAGYDSAPISAIRALCEGWSEGASHAPSAPIMSDPESGLSTAEYLTQRLAEVYGHAQRTGSHVQGTHALVIVDVSMSESDPWQRMARNAAVGDALRAAYGEGHPIARLADGLYAVLVLRGPELGRGIAVLRDRITERADAMSVGNLMRQPPRVWIEALPDTHAYASELLESLRR